MQDCLALWLPEAEPEIEQGEWLRERFEGCLWVAVELTAGGRDSERLERLSALARELGLPCRRGRRRAHAPAPAPCDAGPC
jgi:error-prone DNA polymerase